MSPHLFLLSLLLLQQWDPKSHQENWGVLHVRTWPPEHKATPQSQEGRTWLCLWREAQTNQITCTTTWQGFDSHHLPPGCKVSLHLASIHVISEQVRESDLRGLKHVLYMQAYKYNPFILCGLCGSWHYHEKPPSMSPNFQNKKKRRALDRASFACD